MALHVIAAIASPRTPFRWSFLAVSRSFKLKGHGGTRFGYWVFIGIAGGLCFFLFDFLVPLVPWHVLDSDDWLRWCLLNDLWEARPRQRRIVCCNPGVPKPNWPNCTSKCLRFSWSNHHRMDFQCYHLTLNTLLRNKMLLWIWFFHVSSTVPPCQSQPRLLQYVNRQRNALVLRPAVSGYIVILLLTALVIVEKEERVNWATARVLSAGWSWPNAVHAAVKSFVQLLSRMLPVVYSRYLLFVSLLFGAYASVILAACSPSIYSSCGEAAHASRHTLQYLSWYLIVFACVVMFFFTFSGFSFYRVLDSWQVMTCATDIDASFSSQDHATFVLRCLLLFDHPKCPFMKDRLAVKR